MELVEAVVAMEGIDPGDRVDTVTWGRFIVKDEYVKYWLKDYSVYFKHVCGGSWAKAAALHVFNFAGLHHWAQGFERPIRPVSTYLCRICNPTRMASARGMELINDDVRMRDGSRDSRTLECVACSSQDIQNGFALAATHVDNVHEYTGPVHQYVMMSMLTDRGFRLMNMETGRITS
jgi:hypothetical protein